MKQTTWLSIFLAVAFFLLGDAEAGWRADRMKAMELREHGRYAEAYERVVGNASEKQSDVYDRNFLAGWIALRDLKRRNLAVEHFQKMNSASSKLNLMGNGKAHAESKSKYWLAKSLFHVGKQKQARKLMAGAGEAFNTFYGQLAMAELGITLDKRKADRFASQYPNFQYFWHDDRVEKEIVLALIREESGFDSSARSRAGAIGLMQVMPATAEEIGQSHRVRTDEERLKTSPDYNIAFGSNYFARLIRRYLGSAMLATAAYNAGPSNVDNWLERFGDPREEDVDPVEWVESIPFRETRRYVKRVLSSFVMYKYLGTAGNGENSE